MGIRLSIFAVLEIGLFALGMVVICIVTHCGDNLVSEAGGKQPTGT